jgi:hypothetical protein
MAEIQVFAESRSNNVKQEEIGDEMHEIISSFLEASLNRISLLFTKYTGSACHTSIKLYDKSIDSVKTIARDDIASHDRWGVDAQLGGWFPADKNTAYKSILRDASVSSFASNYLRLRALFGRYDNLNPDWPKLYHACMVVPLTNERNSRLITPETVWGFLTVDNLDGRFDAAYGCALLHSLGRLYYVVFGQLTRAAELEALYSGGAELQTGYSG